MSQDARGRPSLLKGSDDTGSEPALDLPKSRVAPVRCRARRGPVDIVVAHLVRLIVDEHWKAEPAGEALKRLVPSDSMLRKVMVRVSRVQAHPGSRINERALATLNVALGMDQATS